MADTTEPTSAEPPQAPHDKNETWGTAHPDGETHASANTVHQRLRANSSIMQLKKILVANRGEIPIRIFRTAHELSLQTVAVFSYEDRLSMHRQKADEAYVIGKRGQYTPVQAYLAGDEIIKIAKEHGELIHPALGMLLVVVAFAFRAVYRYRERDWHRWVFIFARLCGDQCGTRTDA